jgi:dihydroorotase
MTTSGPPAAAARRPRHRSLAGVDAVGRRAAARWARDGGWALGTPDDARVIDVAASSCAPASSTCTCTCASRDRSTRRPSRPARAPRRPAASPPSAPCRTPTRPSMIRPPSASCARRAARRRARVYPTARLVGQKGERLTEIGEMIAAGAVAITDDGRPVPTAGLMRSRSSTRARSASPSPATART